MTFKDFFKTALSPECRMILRAWQKWILYRLRYVHLRISVFVGSEDLSLILGAALTSQKGWYSTNELWLDISDNGHWSKLFNGQRLIKAVVAEHVFEHLTCDQMGQAIENISKYLIVGGTCRIAVPDGNHPDPEYQEHVKIGGIGPDASDHKQVLTWEVLHEVFVEYGFDPSLVEGYRSNGELVMPREMNPARGIIGRSRISPTIPFGCGEFPDANTSLIVDAVLIKAGIE